MAENIELTPLEPVKFITDSLERLRHVVMSMRLFGSDVAQKQVGLISDNLSLLLVKSYRIDWLRPPARKCSSYGKTVTNTDELVAWRMTEFFRVVSGCVSAIDAINDALVDDARGCVEKCVKCNPSSYISANSQYDNYASAVKRLLMWRNELADLIGEPKLASVAFPAAPKKHPAVVQDERAEMQERAEKEILS